MLSEVELREIEDRVMVKLREEKWRKDLAFVECWESSFERTEKEVRGYAIGFFVIATLGIVLSGIFATPTGERGSAELPTKQHQYLDCSKVDCSVLIRGN